MKEGLVIKSTGSRYIVKDKNNDFYNCVIRGKIRLKGLRTTNPVAVGDKVIIDDKDDTAVITKILERKNYIIRKSTNYSKDKHIIAANIKMAWMIVSLKQPQTRTEFIDRFLVTAEAYSIPATIVINKTDIYDDKTNKKAKELTEIYNSIAYNVIRTSARENINIDKIYEATSSGIHLFLGNSGVGKSSIMNKIDPSLDLKTQEISNYHKIGKHTTTFSELHSLRNGGYIIDTPGIKGFGIVEIPKEELYHHFPEIFKYSSECKFHNCTHTHEPGCAVQKAFEEDKISLSRYDNYLKLFLEEESKYR